jgi:osmoprotectant transport system substrate-binding protein
MKAMKKIAVVVMAMVMCLSLVACGQESKETVRIGHKNFTEQRIVGQLMAVMIENHTDYDTKVTEFGGSSLVVEALNSDEIDVYADYTGTLYATIMKEAGETDPQKVYEMVKTYMSDEYGFNLTDAFGFNNTYTLSVKKEIADQHNLKTISDLVELGPELRLGAFMEFLERPDGLPGVKDTYGIEFKSEIGLDAGIRYTAIESDEVDVIDAFSTDGKILQYDLTVLEDDKQFFPPYYCVSLFSSESTEKYPAAVEAVKMLEGQITDEEMQLMNFKVDEEGLPEKKVAEDFLKEKGLIE